MANTIKIIPPLRTEPVFDELGNFTLRWAEYFEETTEQVNDATDTIMSVIDNTALAQFFALENRIGSGDFLTSDETGFTVDTIKLTVDMDEA